MLDLSIRRDFNEITNEFSNKDFNLKTIEKLLLKLRRHYNKLEPGSILILLNIAMNVLKADTELIDEKGWAGKRSQYFYGNVRPTEDNFLKELKGNFRDEDYHIEDIVDMIDYIKNNYQDTKGEVEFLLRIPEVTIRDDVKIKEYSNFHISGNIFVEEIEKAMKL